MYEQHNIWREIFLFGFIGMSDDQINVKTGNSHDPREGL